MASPYEGMFQNPALIREQRLAGLEQQQAAQRQMGGSFSGLLGQVAAGTGGVLAEGIATAFGLQTAAEKQAAQENAIASSIDWNDPNSIRNGSKLFADAGLTKAAIFADEKATTAEMSDLSRRQKTLEIDKAQISFDEQKRIVEAMPGLREILSTTDTTTPEGRDAAYKAAVAIDVATASELRKLFVEEDKLKATVTANTFGSEANIKDSKGNIYKTTSKRGKNGTYETVYTPITPDAPAAPVGAITILSASGMTPEETIATAGGKAAAVKDAEEWSAIRSAARVDIKQAQSTQGRVATALQLAKQVSTGGWDNKVITQWEKATGEVPDTKADLNYVLEESVVSQLKATFGAQFTEKEGQWLRGILPTIDDGPDAIKAKLARIDKFAADKLKQSQRIIGLDSLAAYDAYLLGENGIGGQDATLGYVNDELSESGQEGNNQEVVDWENL